MTEAARQTPSRRELQAFGLVAGGFTGLLFGLAIPWLRGRSIPWWPFLAAAALVLPALLVPVALAPVHRGWMRAGRVLGWINTRIVLGAVFLVIVTPAALIMRLKGRDPLARRFEPDRPTYRVPSAPAPREKMEVPY